MNPVMLKPPLFLACLMPLAYFAWSAHGSSMDPENIEALRRGLGLWALNLLLITLAVTPLRKYSGWPWLGRLRRMLGLFAFFYAVLHLITYLWLEQSFAWSTITGDILKRPFILAGIVALLLLLPLALTSNTFAIRNLGGRRWQKLHRSSYLVGLLAVLHFAWMSETDTSRPLLYALILAMLLGLRVRWWIEELRRQKAGAPKSRRRIIPVIVRK